MMESASILASRWKRLGGAMIDGVISVAIVWPIMSAVGVLQRAFGGEGMTIRQKVTFLVIGWVVFFTLNGYLLFNRGQTIGKVVVKTKIVDLYGNNPQFGKLLVFRYMILGLVAQIPVVGSFVGLLDSLFIFGKERRCLHDYFAGTRVVEF
jgi:uncharacterized RDD family membrane protein YckC